mmetsp:Transcript_57524/g.103603  ORF Transcript_57524/g.103603 Transcript_57524/m.103603 type:complete len:252 (-) Transcript_57524:524-1279(-)
MQRGTNGPTATRTVREPVRECDEQTWDQCQMTTAWIGSSRPTAAIPVWIADGMIGRTGPTPAQISRFICRARGPGFVTTLLSKMAVGLAREMPLRRRTVLLIAISRIGLNGLHARHVPQRRSLSASVKWWRRSTEDCHASRRTRCRPKKRKFVSILHATRRVSGMNGGSGSPALLLAAVGRDSDRGTIFPQPPQASTAEVLTETKTNAVWLHAPPRRPQQPVRPPAPQQTQKPQLQPQPPLPSQLSQPPSL